MLENTDLHSPSQLDKLIGYQTNSVISKTIINKPTGLITLFAFDKGEGFSEHTTSFDAMPQILDNEEEVIIAGKINLVKKEEMVIMPANQLQALKAKEKFKLMLVTIKS